MVQQTSQSCPAICIKTCAPDCPVRCCNLPPPSPYVPSPPPAPIYCPQICFSTCVSYCPMGCCTNAQQGVSRQKLSYTVNLPCPSNCYPTCHGNCPPQCCKTAAKRTSSLVHSAVKSSGVGNYLTMHEESVAPFTSFQTPSDSSIMIRSKLLCPEVCSKVCLKTCPAECCRGQKNGSNKQKKWRNAALGN